VSPHQVRGLGLRQVLEVAEDDRGSLPDRQRHQGSTEAFSVRQVIRIDGRRLGLPFQVPAFDAAAAVVGPREVDDGLPQIGVEPPGIAEVQQSSGDPDERVLDEVLGEGTIPGQEIGKTEGLVRVTGVEIREQAALDPDRLHVGTHPRPPRSPTRGVGVSFRSRRKSVVGSGWNRADPNDPRGTNRRNWAAGLKGQLRACSRSATSAAFPQHPDEHRPKHPLLLAVDQ
jgi:hypothetical protein